jgi:hypothetical protein
LTCWWRRYGRRSSGTGRSSPGRAEGFPGVLGRLGRRFSRFVFGGSFPLLSLLLAFSGALTDLLLSWHLYRTSPSLFLSLEANPLARRGLTTGNLFLFLVSPALLVLLVSLLVQARCGMLRLIGFGVALTSFAGPLTWILGSRLAFLPFLLSLAPFYFCCFHASPFREEWRRVLGLFGLQAA